MRARAAPSGDVLAYRVRRAVLIVMALFVGVLLLGACSWAGRSGVVREVVHVGDVSVSSQISDEVPSEFVRECVLPEEATEVRVAKRSDGGVVGFVLPGQLEVVFGLLSDRLCEGGWTKTGDGQDACGSFVKGVGTCCWAFVACVQVGDSTSVVVHYAMTDERS